VHLVAATGADIGQDGLGRRRQVWLSSLLTLVLQDLHHLTGAPIDRNPLNFRICFSEFRRMSLVYIYIYIYI
jgi:hypothetical protein